VCAVALLLFCSGSFGGTVASSSPHSNGRLQTIADIVEPNDKGLEKMDLLSKVLVLFF
jgi:hypothetical protein